VDNLQFLYFTEFNSESLCFSDVMFIFGSQNSSGMKKIDFRSILFWNSVLTFSMSFVAFILPLMPIEWQGYIFRIAYTVVYVSALFSLENRSKHLITLFLITFILEWISGIFDLDAMFAISRSTNMLFFLVIVVFLIRQIATAKEVTATVIFGSITGYLLLGLMYSMLVTIIIKNNPGAYSNLPENIITLNGANASVPLYYTFITLASLGYGDICPLTPIARSLATFITVSGQFYMAVIVAMLVGKFLTKTAETKEP
jgi:hypothetical protein